ncbi:MAG: hypothetical protein GX605_01465 [Chloroflexi bacterium]|nr:hypothetical protein [Chloroflexota bacterium]
MIATAQTVAGTEQFASVGLETLGVRYGLASNNPHLILNPEFYGPGEIQSLVTAIGEFRFVPYGPDMDAYMTVVDVPGRAAEVITSGKHLYCLGDWGRLDREKHDRRLTLMGNIGLFYRYSLAVMEHCGVYSLHASCIYRPDRNELLIIVGGPGAGKTVYLLEGIQRDYQIFSTEMTFFKFTSQGVVFYRGSLLDNIRLGNFVYDYPQAAEKLGLALPKTDNPWTTKISVHMDQITTKGPELLNPRLTFIFPRIESGREVAVVTDIKRPEGLVKGLFDNASEKIGGSFLLYDNVPVAGFDTPEVLQRRLQAMRKLVEASQWEIVQAKSVLAGSKNCMEGIE